jgi:hypothetical protein
MYALASTELPVLLEGRPELRTPALVLFLLGAAAVFSRPAVLINTWPLYQRPLIRYVQNAAPLDGRLMIETRDDGMPHVADWLAATTGQPIIGGPHPGSHMIGRYTLFSGLYLVNDRFHEEPVAFGRRLSDMDEAAFARALSDYHVVLIAARSEAVVKALAGWTEAVRPLEPLGGFMMFEVRHPSGWFAEGSGRVKFDFDRIDIDDASKGTLILKAHWLPTLRAEPPLDLKPRVMGDDPAPFIEISNDGAASHITIVNHDL